MKTYEIPCIWQMYGKYHIEAASLKEAMQIAYDAQLPEDSEYIESSFGLDIPIIEELYPDEEQLNEEKVYPHCGAINSLKTAMEDDHDNTTLIEVERCKICGE